MELSDVVLIAMTYKFLSMWFRTFQAEQFCGVSSASVLLAGPE